LNTQNTSTNYGLGSDTADLRSLSASGEQHSHHMRSRESQVNSAWTEKMGLIFVLALGPWAAAPLAHWAIQN